MFRGVFPNNRVILCFRSLLLLSAVAAFAAPAWSADPVVSGATCDCRLGQDITVTFSGLDAWIMGVPAKAGAPPAPPMPAVPGGDASKLVLALNGNLLKGIHPKPYQAGSDKLVFRLQRTPDNRDTWNTLLSKSTFRYQNTMTVGVGPENGNALFAGSPTIQFEVLPDKKWVGGSIAFLALLLATFVILAMRSNIVRDAGDLGENTLGSYSLARSQMAWWLFILIGSYGYIFAITGDIDTITQGVLVLMGISAGAGLGSLVVDSTKQNQRKSLEAEQASLTSDLSNLTSQLSGAPANADDLRATLAQKQARLAEVVNSLRSLPLPTMRSQGFLLDILSDDSGVNFHRFQMAAWTLVLGIIFIHEVWTNLAMPDFSATLLGLLGISSGTYLGFKIPDSPK